MRFLLDDPRGFGMNTEQWTTVAQNEGEWSKMEEQEAGCFMVTWTAAEKPGLDYGMKLYISEHDGKEEVDDRSNKSCSCWFPRESRSGTSSAILYSFLFCLILFRFRLFCFQ